MVLTHKTDEQGKSFPRMQKKIPPALSLIHISFFDLCDCTRRSAEQLDQVLKLLGRFATRRTVVLSLNENEALDCGRKLLDGLDNLSALTEALCLSLIHISAQTVYGHSHGL